MQTFIYSIKRLIRSKSLVFWTLIFPLALGTLFYLAFGNLMGDEETFHTIPVAVVFEDNSQYRASLTETLEQLTDGQSPLLQVTYANEEEAEALLREGEVAAYITVGNTIDVSVTEVTLNQSIVRTLVDEYLQSYDMIMDLLTQNPNADLSIINKSYEQTYLQAKSVSDAVPDTMLSYFYALIAMTCMFGSYWGLKIAIDTQANLSPLGARRAVSPTHKLKAIATDALASLLLLFIETLLVIAYLTFVLGVDFGPYVGYIMLTALLGCFSGIAFGLLVGTASKKGEGVKNGILTSVSLALSFLAGLMFVDMKYIIASSAPILSFINPAALLSDAFYALYIYGPGPRLWLNLGLLFTISIVLYLISYFILRRQKYASL